MKNLLLLAFILWLQTVVGQNSYSTLMQKAKAEFARDFYEQDYKRAIYYLEEAVKLEPDSAEAHYYLGYAYSRLNSKDAKDMSCMSLPLVLKCSKEFEKVNELTPLYKGEVVVLYPYSKITSEWGSMATSYLSNGNVDSARWAFNEGRKRGGFGDFFLAEYRLTLDECSPNAILISSGDNPTFNLWYLQTVENYRTDVAVVDVSLLNAQWYPLYLLRAGKVEFDFPAKKLDTIDYCYWKEKQITIGKFSWKLKPTYQEHYLLKGDRVLLSMLRANNFKREVYFTIAFMEESRLWLQDYMLPNTLADKLNTSKEPDFPVDNTLEQARKALLSYKLVNPNNRNELEYLDNVRYRVVLLTDRALKGGDKAGAKRFLDTLDQDGGLETYPYLRKEFAEYVDYLRSLL